MLGRFSAEATRASRSKRSSAVRLFAMSSGRNFKATARLSFTVDYEARELIWRPVEPLSDSLSCDPRFSYPTVSRCSRELHVQSVDFLGPDVAKHQGRLVGSQPRPCARTPYKTNVLQPDESLHFMVVNPDTVERRVGARRVKVDIFRISRPTRKSQGQVFEI